MAQKYLTVIVSLLIGALLGVVATKLMYHRRASEVQLMVDEQGRPVTLLAVDRDPKGKIVAGSRFTYKWQDARSKLFFQVDQECWEDGSLASAEGWGVWVLKDSASAVTSGNMQNRYFDLTKREQKKR